MKKGRIKIDFCITNKIILIFSYISIRIFKNDKYNTCRALWQNNNEVDERVKKIQRI